MLSRLNNWNIKEVPLEPQQPLHGELFGIEQSVRHAKQLAENHRVFIQPGPNLLLSALDQNEKCLRIFNRDTRSVDRDRRITHAAEWVLDNFYLIEEQIQLTRRHLPPGYSRELPRLLGGVSANLPRVYDLVLELISHVDAQVDLDCLRPFIEAYQTIAPLTLGELWAIPIMIRLGLIENLQRVTTRLTIARGGRDLADFWMNRLQEVVESSPSELVVIMAEMAKSEPIFSSSFISEFCQRLSRQSPVMSWVRNWLEQKLAEQGESIERLIHQENQIQATDQVAITHSINSLRSLSSIDWKMFVESVSLVEKNLREDPAGVYPRMDFATRDRYRHVIETISRFSQTEESKVALEVVALSQANLELKGKGEPEVHVGYFLIGKGRPILEKVMRMRKPWRMLWPELVVRFPLTFYAGGILLLTGVSTGAFWLFSKGLTLSEWSAVLLTICFALAVSQLSLSLINWLVTIQIQPRLLPRVDCSLGIPAGSATMVAIPTIINGVNGIDDLLESLEIHYLGNRDPQINFALLTDFADAPKETMPEDEVLIGHVRAGVELLNKKYTSDRPGLFFLLHRPRRWDEGEGCWMGFERKRGKLSEFNDLILGDSGDRFSEIIGDRAVLATIQFVITLDTDTQLPRDAAGMLVGTMIHPLNRPCFHPVTGMVTKGYSILQPRVEISLPSADRSYFLRLCSGEVGIDPYTQAVSDVYQDLFGEGSFIGKGIYDVRAFTRATKGRLPEKTVLSHDLIEACLARSALVSDVELYEAYPSRYATDVNRRHRWIRGDWQIAQWLGSRVPGPQGKMVRNPLSGLSQWKILDNLRRSLVPVALLFFLVGSWTIRPRVGALGVTVLVLILGLPRVLSLLRELTNKSKEFPLWLHLQGVSKSLGREAGQLVLSLALLPYEAAFHVDAIGRTAWRLLISHHHLLQWKTSSDAERGDRRDLLGSYLMMWSAPAVSLLVGGYLLVTRGTLGGEVWPFILLWLVAPFMAWFISLPLDPELPNLKEKQRVFLRKTARRTWRYFETFVNQEENWLPPDNFQEQPTPRVASRTSPTNMGLALLANLAACDFGYLSVAELMRRSQLTLNSMKRLQKYRGHFYNWYNTRTCEPLSPMYISSVDSGNLVGHLLTLGPGFLELAEQDILSPEIFAGFRDTLGVLQELVVEKFKYKVIFGQLKVVPSTLRGQYQLLQRIAQQLASLALPADSETEARWWTAALQQSGQNHLNDLQFLAPWLALGPLESLGTVLDSGLSAKVAQLSQSLTLQEVAALSQTLCPLLENAASILGHAPNTSSEQELLTKLLPSLYLASDRAGQRLLDLQSLARQSHELAQMDFRFLFDHERDLFSIGFNVAEHRCDASFYDLLASESRLCSYVAIAQGQVTQEHWFSLSRLLLSVQGRPVLASWSGSLFEYLMPLLVMPTYRHTLLDQTYLGAVAQQIAYGRSNAIPWGVSESGYNRTDANLNYQYRAFGVPGLGLKRGLASDLVIAPYASVLALMIQPQSACANLERLAQERREGAFGFYEAVDYTPSRLPPGQTSVTIQSFMVHHQGMSLLALDCVLLHGPMQRRFAACPELKASELLLQERIPKSGAKVLADDWSIKESRRLAETDEGIMRIIENPNIVVPEVHLMSNGRYHVIVSNAGGGSSRWNNLAVTRWQEDSTRDCWGSFVYLRDVEEDAVWSATYQPTLRNTKNYQAIFTQARAEFRQHYLEIEVHYEISVSPEDDVEIRRVTLTNHTDRPRTIELTSYAEVVLATAASDSSHPAFSNLFVQTSFVPSLSALICTRRARSETEKPPWMFHLLVGQGGEQGEISYETDRGRFIGRDRNLTSPEAMQQAAALSNTVGSVLDPIISLRRQVTIPPNGQTRLDFLVGVTDSEATVMVLAEKYHSARMADRAFDLAWTHSQVTLRQLNISETEAQLYSRLASALLYVDRAHRANPSVLLSNRKGQNGLWSHGISGDFPLVLLRISDRQRMEIVWQLLQAHAYWRMKGVTVDLVILNEDDSLYRQPLHEEILRLISSGIEAHLLDKPGGIFLRNAEQISPEDRILLQSVARVIIVDENGTLAEQVERPAILDSPVPLLMITRAPIRESSELPSRNLILENGLGGFTLDGREYVTRLLPGQTTPAPWVNVLANPNFGTVISESGSAYTWSENSHEFRLTPWTNDPVSDSAGEYFYLRDEQSGQIWSPTPLPIRSPTPYVVRHGFGYTVFEHQENGLYSELWIYVAMDAPIKFAVLKLRNDSRIPRRISVTGYCEWVLGELRQKNLLHVQTELDPKSGALLARNPYNTEFSERVAFFDVNDAGSSFTGDRREFLGRNGGPARPAALRRLKLSGRVGAALDPCGALQISFDLAPGQEQESVFRLGIGKNAAEVQNLLQRFRRPGAARQALEEVWKYWNRTLGAVQIETPDPAVNILGNGWLLYQTLSCRLWARTGFYQSGGAYGFRDQLQDVMALVHSEPNLVREQLLRAAAHQFLEGDVQHWWHPPTGRGVRTHFSDDFLWLPYVTCHYVESLADTGILRESVSFLKGRVVRPDEDGYYDLPSQSGESATLYEHCRRALERGLKFGVHGLPLIGCGDWNDGMNMIGHEGRGESVWLGFFLYDVLNRFAELAKGFGDEAMVAKCLDQAALLQKNLELHAWDGQWYLRAFFDNGEPLGSHTNEECQIDSLPQSWSIISGAGERSRSTVAMQSVVEQLVRRDDRLIELFKPPFDHSRLNPGYIKGYIPGVRENGGQYTHAAIWTIMAFAMMGKTEEAWELFALINPIRHADTPEHLAIYRVEPYVVAADVYGVSPHVGRGGWTWYTGSAGWMYRLVIETLLGLKRRGDRLLLTPSLPKAWNQTLIHYRYHQTSYRIQIVRASDPAHINGGLTLDGRILVDGVIPLADDGVDHVVEVKIR